MPLLGGEGHGRGIDGPWGGASSVQLRGEFR